MGDRIKCLSIVQLSSSHILFTEFLNKIYEDQFRNELISLIPSLAKLTLSPHDFQKFHTSNGTWFSSIDSTRTAILILTSSSFPLASTMRLQKEIQAEIQKIPRYFDPQSTNLKEVCKTNIYNLMKCYDSNPDHNDSLSDTKRSVDEVHIQMEKNVKKLIESTEQLTDIEEKTYKMDEAARNFKERSSDLQKKMWKEKHKQTLIIAAILIGIIVVFIFMIKTITP